MLKKVLYNLLVLVVVVVLIAGAIFAYKQMTDDSEKPKVNIHLLS